jgi:hypothetical protein
MLVRERREAQEVPRRVVRSQRARDLDVVLLSADSLGTIKRTHSSYFDMKSLDKLLPA